VPFPNFALISTSHGQLPPSIPVPNIPSSSKGTFLDRPMDPKQVKRLNVDENARAYSLH